MLPSLTGKRIQEGDLSIIGFKTERNLPLFTIAAFHIQAFKQLLKEPRPILIFDYPMLPLFVGCKLLKKTKGVMMILSRPVAVKGLLGKLKSVSFRLSLILAELFVHGFTAITPFEANQFSNIAKIPREKIVVVASPLGQVFEKFDPKITENQLRGTLRLNTLLGQKVLLCHGVLDCERGIMEVVSVFSKVSEGKNLTLLLVGKGPLERPLKEFIQTRKLSNVIVLGYVPYWKMPEVIAASDIGLVLLPDHPWWRYQCPTKLVELLALGKPVIASDLHGIRWVTGSTPSVFFLKDLSENSFRRALDLALAYAEDESAKEAARNKIIDRFSSERMASRLVYLINS